ncbi:hypothetical protein Glove_880g7 [Diversispora epigaea]|uniref:Uncharacterized protein n=1 Tax=Diversispora epigaea TaxID=1348612 RepID=A0A397G2D5_9GLOM|nr:hypothetical protein Glove_880g7 [Diversispora epigaea]
MSNFIAVSVGFLTSSALLYRFQSDIENNTNQIRKKLYNSQKQLKAALPNYLNSELKTESLTQPFKTPNNRPQLPIPSISQTQNYISYRLIPTFKATWNDHIITFANKVTNFEVNETAKTAVIKVKSFAEDRKWTNDKK